MYETDIFQDYQDFRTVILPYYHFTAELLHLAHVNMPKLEIPEKFLSGTRKSSLT